MRGLLLLLLGTVLAACAGSREPRPDVLAIKDFVEVSGLEEVDRIRADRVSGFDELNLRYIIFETRRQDYLIEFDRDCWEIRDSFDIRADHRHDPNYIRPRLDTIRGCRIQRAFEINEGQVEELKAMGEAPNAGNQGR